ncbi:MAG: hypothetical protein BXU00_00750 [Candidatus Nanoclepta minutus]|uniref:tRNA pseudouridine synthase n=1 Tax=Candidatus Nanoclepta minutus TaxID=1940235 RepID=A0A397WPZ1_9ARCH|nr:MAG: hypothetical protein BXU00_00750 [Candidatus Nanoclepta minutus]
MPAYLLKVSYRGEKFQGVVPQKDARTIIGEILDFFNIKSYRYSIVSRTDKGVSAKENYIVLKTDNEIKFDDFFHEDIKIMKVFKLSSYINIRKFSIGKRYVYNLPKGLFDKFYLPKWLIIDGYKIDVRGKEEEFDIKRYIEASRYFIGKKSFHNFSKGKAKDPICKIKSFDVINEDKYITNIIEGNRFLYEMVRRIITFLISVGKGLYPIDKINLVFIGELDPKPFPADPRYLTLEKVYLKWKELYKHIEEIIL